MDAPFRQVQRHGPVVGNGVDDPGKARVDCRLGGPDMRRHIGCVLRQISEQRRHELRALLVGGVVGQLAEAFGIDRLPHEFVEQPELLAESGAEGVQLVLPGDDPGAGGLREGVEIQPVWFISQGAGSRSDGHGDAVVAVAHADIADDDGVVGKLKSRLVRQRERLDPEGGENGVVNSLEIIVFPAVVPVLFEEFLLLSAGLPVSPRRDFIPEDDFRAIHRRFPPHSI